MWWDKLAGNSVSNIENQLQYHKSQNFIHGNPDDAMKTKRLLLKTGKNPENSDLNNY